MGESSAAAEKAAEKSRNKELYNILAKEIAGERKRREVGEKDKQGVLKTEAR